MEQKHSVHTPAVFLPKNRSFVQRGKNAEVFLILEEREIQRIEYGNI